MEQDVEVRWHGAERKPLEELREQCIAELDIPGLGRPPGDPNDRRHLEAEHVDRDRDHEPRQRPRHGHVEQGPSIPDRPA
jgi:hypothetical protein